MGPEPGAGEAEVAARGAAAPAGREAAPPATRAVGWEAPEAAVWEEPGAAVWGDPEAAGWEGPAPKGPHPGATMPTARAAAAANIAPRLARLMEDAYPSIWRFMHILVSLVLWNQADLPVASRCWRLAR